MTRAISACLVAAATLASMKPATSQQQQPVPHVGYVYPAGGQLGTTFHVELGGQFLNGVRRALVSGGGVHVRVLDHERLLTPQELTGLRDTAQALQRELRQRPNDPVLRQRLEALVDRVSNWQRRRANPSLSEIVTIEVAIAPDAAMGERRLRLQTPLGLTNPLVFCVGRLAEFREPDNMRTVADMGVPVTLPAVVNGRLIPRDPARGPIRPRVAPQSLSGDVDRYRFRAVKGQHLVAVASARALRPYLGDAVPGWFQAALTLRDAEGRELAYNDDFRFDPDPVLEFTIPADGDYVLEIKDALYRGRDDFVYRVAIGEGPPVAAILAQRTGTFALSSDTLPEVRETEPNDTPPQAQRIVKPIVINGRIDRANDPDVFTFNGRAGDTIVAEVYARRSNSPIDAVLDLTDASGRRIAWNDDHDDKAAGLETHHADSWLMAALPTTGQYYVRVGDVQRHGGPEYVYRLRVGAPRPDFALRVSPSSVNASGANTVPVTVTAIRHDGFSGDIAVSLVDAPRGFVLSGGVVPAGEEQVRMTLTFPPAPRGAFAGNLPDPIALGVAGNSTINGRVVTHVAVPADDMMQAFFYHHLVVADDLWVATIGRGGVGSPARIVGDLPVRIVCGAKTAVRVALPFGYRLVNDLELKLSEPPSGMTLAGFSIDGSAATVTLEADEARLKPGQRGNLIVEVSGVVPRPANAPATQQPRKMVLGYLPAIPFAVVR